jgi:sec-independent protein translocase protein TatA
MKTKPSLLLYLLVALLLGNVSDAFLTTSSQTHGGSITRQTIHHDNAGPTPKPSYPTDTYGSSLLPLKRQRRSVANVQTFGLFGLGAAEIAIVVVVAAFLLGPQKIAELGKDAGKIAGELKEVPKEFQKEFSKGLDEGETDARSRKAKPMKRIDPENEMDA